MELVKPVEPVLWASIVELVIGGTGYGTVEALDPGNLDHEMPISAFTLLRKTQVHNIFLGTGT